MRTAVARTAGGVFLAPLMLAAVGAFAAEAPPSSTVLPLNPVALSVPLAPQPFAAGDGRTHLTWEVQALNLTRASLQVQSISVWAADGSRELLQHTGDAIPGRLTALGDWTQGVSAIGPSAGATVWLDLALDAGESVPAALETRISVVGEGVAASDAVTRVVTPVDMRPARIIRPPLAGDLWGVLEACCDASNHHRRGQRSVDGHFVLPERYAIDFVQLDRDGELYTGSNINENYYGFGQPVFAVANATVVDVYDALEDVPPGAALPPPSLPQAGGNHVVLDLGDGVWAMYGHLKAGSIGVQVGQHVRAGDVLAQLGNNGNSDLAHLHFQLMDSRNFALAQGLPFVFDHYVLVGRMDIQADRIDYAARPGRMRNRLPLTLSVVDFPLLRQASGDD